MKVLFDFIDYQREDNLKHVGMRKHVKVQELRNRAQLIDHCRRQSGASNLLAFAEMVEIEPLRLILTFICADPSSFNALSRSEYIAIAEVCSCNISNWENWLPS